MPARQISKIKKLVPLLLSWFSTNARGLPWRRTRDPYAIWVSEIMLQQTQVKTVMPYWERWMRALPTIASVAKAPPAKLHKLWEGLGYYTRVRNLQKAAQEILAQHDGKFPEKFDDILALPGIGRYTAGAIASIAFDQPKPILDGNVIRILTRLFGINGDPREKQINAQLWQLAAELVTHAKNAKTAKPPRQSPLRPSRPLREDNSCSHLNQSLMELGALLCTPRNPRCDVCPVQQLCVACRRGWQEKIPNVGKRAEATARRFIAFVVERNGKYLVRQRPPGVVNAHLWEFPNVEVGARRSGPQRGRNHGSLNNSRTPEPLDLPRPARPCSETNPRPGFKLTATKPLCRIKHSITRYRIALEAYRAETMGRRRALQGEWLTLPQLDKLAFASAHRKILVQLLNATERKSPTGRIPK
jgi:A/G-specific adenine glycosylase